MTKKTNSKSPEPSEEREGQRPEEEDPEAAPEDHHEEEPDDEGALDDEEPWDDEVDPLASAEDAIDPELLALADERPQIRWHRPVVMFVVCGLIIAMMVWFWRDVQYFFSPTEPIDLGEAHDVTFDEGWENRYVRLEGIPLAPRNQNPAPQCGRNQGFPTYQRRSVCRGHLSAIPLMGRPDHDLIVQRYMMRQLRIHYEAPEGRGEEQVKGEVEAAARRVNAVHEVRPALEGELGRLIVDVEGSAGRTDISAVAKSIRFQIEASVAGIKRVRVERVRREVPGSFEGRLVRLSDLGSRFAAVADFLNECTNYSLNENTWVVLDGSEAGTGALDNLGVCYGQAPRQYWIYLALYVALALILVLNIFLLIRFFRRAGQGR